MTLLFLKVDGQDDHHAILNTMSICYMEGIDVTDEHPGGSKTRIVMTGGQVILHEPYKVIADQIAKSVEQGYVLSEQINEARRKAANRDTKEILTDVLGGTHHNHD